jgi:hypothetical protein
MTSGISCLPPMCRDSCLRYPQTDSLDQTRYGLDQHEQDYHQANRLHDKYRCTVHLLRGLVAFRLHPLRPSLQASQQRTQRLEQFDHA